ncbi:putative ABC transporter permease protein [Actinoplanes missouriensis 431]|uniref:Putative ABC transporter permease protein n=1 Tax=Actinoplanes missouriensis (strain ATCC 14538 / DSM 43046 / CBS 188.64 / JCM 3121 / NBRC 102363 / NCIMB 12654 / NRRL B-3342 / UNCC 431) TaxID=512565 RepID=I0HCZ5_ACTM4|nr:ABC transporter permease [Actinoplanes missouriensis]BAL90882.1 putative ABC transporter permease protein [Actinoplanes missouriensis 431]
MGFLGRKLAALVATVAVASLVIFGALYLAPGDPAALLAGGHQPNPAALAEIRARYHLDDPFLAQYWHWLSGLLSGYPGDSMVLKEPVTALIAARMPTTALLVAYASLLILILGVSSGIVAGVAGRRVDGALTVTTTVLMAAPAFVAAILLIWVFATKLAWFPVYGSGTGFAGRIHHLTLPALALSGGYLAYVSRITRTEVRAELGSDHVAAARARGLPRGHVLGRHVLRNAAPPILAVSGVTVAGLFAGTAVAEQAFGVSGLGSLLVQSAARQDMVVVQALALLLVAVFVLVNTLVDVLNAVLDPRLLKERPA